MEIKFLGNATIVFSCQNDSILFDPFFPLNKLLPSSSPKELSEEGDIFITHGHFDHLMHVADVLLYGEKKVYCSKGAAKTLLREGVNEEKIEVIKSGDVIKKGSLKVTVLKSEHILFDIPTILKSLFSNYTIKHFNNLIKIIKLSFHYRKGEVFAFLIEAENKKVLHFGSLNLSEEQKYPKNVDLLTLPYQGRSDLSTYAVSFIDFLSPKKVYMHHFDDSFPPVSAPMNILPFIKNLSKRETKIPVIIPKYGESVTF